jgi:hypothetical protein
MPPAADLRRSLQTGTSCHSDRHPTAAPQGDSGLVPEFLVDPPVAVTAPRSIKITATQIQYAQQVFLNFNGLTWPHVSVATLVPASPVMVPASTWS